MKFLKSDPSAKDTDLQMTPIIDVVFQLLIFFLVGTKFRVPEGELEAYLPHTGGPAEQLQEAPEVGEIRITLKVSQGGPNAMPVIEVDNTKAGTRMGSSREENPIKWLQNRLYALAANEQMREMVPVIIEAEPHLAYRWVISALNGCRKARFQKVSFARSRRNLGPGPAAPPG